MITTRKIRIFPEHPDRYIEFLHLYRRAYNLTIEQFKLDVLPDSALRRSITATCKTEYRKLLNVNVIHEAYRKACTTRQAILRKRKNGKRADYSFMSWKHSSKYFLVAKLGINGTIYVKSLGKVLYAEDNIPPEAILKNAVVSYTHGEWHISLKKFTTLKKISETASRVIALDPGVRTFMTSYSQLSSTKYGEGFCNDKLLPLMLELDSLLSYKDSLLTQIDTESGVAKQYVFDRLKWIEKRINSARSKQNNLVLDLHRRVAYDLVMNNDVILLPTFEVKQMIIKKSDTGKKRKIRKKTVRSMLSLSHYKFKLTLKWMARKYGKVVLDVSEAYTSKTLWDGSLKNNLGSADKINFNGIVVDRDIHGARNILIKFLTEFTSEKLSLASI